MLHSQAPHWLWGLRLADTAQKRACQDGAASWCSTPGPRAAVALACQPWPWAAGSLLRDCLASTPVPGAPHSSEGMEGSSAPLCVCLPQTWPQRDLPEHAHATPVFPNLRLHLSHRWARKSVCGQRGQTVFLAAKGYVAHLQGSEPKTGKFHFYGSAGSVATPARGHCGAAPANCEEASCSGDTWHATARCQRPFPSGLGETQ